MPDDSRAGLLNQLRHVQVLEVHVRNAGDQGRVNSWLGVERESLFRLSQVWEGEQVWSLQESMMLVSFMTPCCLEAPARHGDHAMRLTIPLQRVKV